MKKIYIILILLLYLIDNALLLAASNTDFKSETAVSTAPGNSDFKAAASFTPLPHDTCLDKKFSIVFYLIQDSAYTLPTNTNSPLFSSNSLPTYSLTDIVNKLNQTFERICVSFENCKVVIIPNYFYNRWTVNTTDSVVTDNWYTPNAINVYMPTLMLNPEQDHPFAYSSAFPGNTLGKDFIVLTKSVLLPNSVNFTGSILLHAFGHFFGLPHTYAETSVVPALPYGPSTEAANGSNCSTHGDGFCDTEPDPYPHGYDNSASAPPCSYDYTPGYNIGAGYYVPPVDNIMSNYSCRCKFTQEQYNYMARIIMTKRLYLH